MYELVYDRNNYGLQVERGMYPYWCKLDSATAYSFSFHF